jgi:quinol monooxygenase YgiN
MPSGAFGECLPQANRLTQHCQSARKTYAPFPLNQQENPMVITTISFMVAPGKNHEALEYFHQIVREIKKLNGTDVRVLTQLGGPMGHFVLSSQFESLAAWDLARTKITNDGPFQKLVTEAGKAGLFIPGTTTSAIWQQV